MPKLNFYPACGLNSYEGYGRTEIGMLKGLAELGISPSLWPDKSVVTLQFGNAKWGASPFMQGQRIWLFTMLESTLASQNWVDNINRYYERLICPAPSMVEMFEASGVEVPIHYIPLGVDAFPLPYQRRTLDKPFTFLTYSYGDIRKGAELAVMAFRMLYLDNPDYRLIVKVRDNAEIQWLQTIKSEQISVVPDAISEQALQDLYLSAHCFVFPSRAEGFGLPPREATLSGLPTIATQWLGMGDIRHWGYPLSISAMLPCQYMKEINNRTGALWSEPDFEDLLHWMAWIPTNYEQALEDNLKHITYLNTFTWKRVAQEFMDLLEAYQ